jgi:hypothetical protein
MVEKYLNGSIAEGQRKDLEKRVMEGNLLDRVHVK